MAKVISFQIPKSQREFIRFQEDRGQHFYDKLHQHPQLQLTLILEGRGQFFSGEYLGRFQPGDVFFLGANAAHVFRSDPEFFDKGSELSSSGNTVFFDFQALGKAISEVEDLASLQRFGQMSGTCFRVKGEGLEMIQEILENFGAFRDLQRFLQGIRLLTILESEDCELLPLNENQPRLNERDGARMNRVMEFMLRNRFEPITLEQTADQANMSKEAFCRFFKLRTRKTFTQYLQLLRVAEAQKLLSETDLSISEIAYRVGYENLSYFNRSFKTLTGIAPREWKRKQLSTSV